MFNDARITWTVGNSETALTRKLKRPPRSPEGDFAARNQPRKLPKQRFLAARTARLGRLLAPAQLSKLARPQQGIFAIAERRRKREAEILARWLFTRDKYHDLGESGSLEPASGQFRRVGAGFRSCAVAGSALGLGFWPLRGRKPASSLKSIDL